MTKFSATDIFHFDINQDQGPTYTPYKISAKYTIPFRRNGFKGQGQLKFC